MRAWILGFTASVACLASPAQMFSEAEKYEQFMGRWSQRLAPKLVDYARITDGARVLDVGSGTGALSLAIASAHPRCEVVGIDPSPAYVEFARTRSPNPRIRFEVGDAQNLRLPDKSVDASLASLVINFIPDARKAVSEMRRVTKPGGTVAACVWDYNEGMTMLRVFWDAAVALDPAAEKLDERHMPYSRKGQLAALWTASGLADVEDTALEIQLDFASFDDYWAPFLNGQGPAGAYAVSLPAERRAALENRLRAAVLRGRPDGPFTMKARAWAVRGRVPDR